LGIPEEITTLSTGALILLQKPVNSYTKKPAHSGGFMLALRTGIEPLKITLKSPVSKIFIWCVEFRVEYQLGQMEKFMAKVA